MKRASDFTRFGCTSCATSPCGAGPRDLTQPKPNTASDTTELTVAVLLRGGGDRDLLFEGGVEFGVAGGLLVGPAEALHRVRGLAGEGMEHGRRRRRCTAR